MTDTRTLKTPDTFLSNSLESQSQHYVDTLKKIDDKIYALEEDKTTNGVC